MEQLRILIAIVLSFLVFFLWNTFFMDSDAPQKPRPAAVATGEKDQAAALKGAESPSQAPAPAGQSPSLSASGEAEKSPTLPSGQAPPRSITVDTPLYSATLSARGANFTSFILKGYRETVAPDSAQLQMVPASFVDGTVQVGLEGGAISGLKEAVFDSSFSGGRLDVSDKPRVLSFSWTSPEGVTLEKHYAFTPDDYRVELRVVLRNGSAQFIKDSLFVSIFKMKPSTASTVGFEGPAALINGSLKQVDLDDLEDKNVFSGKIRWIALQSRYFLSAVVPQAEEEASMKVLAHEDGRVEAQYIYAAGEIPAGGSSEFVQKVLIGPKSLKLLSRYGDKLSKVIDFGWFDIVAKPGVYILNFIYDFIPNYGVAIIILTILTKILLWPLGQKSYKSMAQMKKLQPLITDLRAKYANDKKKMNEEVMNLYRTYKVNPMGGCLPMVVQIPIFIALYRMLYETIELRHAPFFGWINDLSAPDRLFDFGFSIPLMEPPYGIPVLTLVMGATMFLQQKMTPPMGDPTQAKMMMLLPVVFTFIFINFSSGLVLYWLVNNVFSISQQYYTNQRNA